MLVMVEKGIKGGICHSIYRYLNANNKHMQDYNKKKELLKEKERNNFGM